MLQYTFKGKLGRALQVVVGDEMSTTSTLSNGPPLYPVPTNSLVNPKIK
jgi:hypothetical protein